MRISASTAFLNSPSGRQPGAAMGWAMTSGMSEIVTVDIAADVARN
jgi:hypothetical protein